MLNFHLSALSDSRYPAFVVSLYAFKYNIKKRRPCWRKKKEWHKKKSKGYKTIRAKKGVQDSVSQSVFSSFMWIVKFIGRRVIRATLTLVPQSTKTNPACEQRPVDLLVKISSQGTQNKPTDKPSPGPLNPERSLPGKYCWLYMFVNILSANLLQGTGSSAF